MAQTTKQDDACVEDLDRLKRVLIIGKTYQGLT